MKKSTSTIFSVGLILVGLIFLLANFNLIEIPQIRGFATWWPVFLILIGGALAFRKKLLAISFIILGLLFFTVYSINVINYGNDELIIVQDSIKIGKAVDLVQFESNFAAGNLTISKGGINNFNYIVKTSIEDNPEVKSITKDRLQLIKLDRNSDSLISIGNVKEEWIVLIPTVFDTDIDLNIAVSSVNLDLEGLNIRTLNVDAGMSEIEIKFDKYPTKADIDVGASSVKLIFPAGYPVKVDVKNGLSSVNFDDFTKEDGIFHSDGFDENKDYIDIIIDAGASSVDGEFR